ncbi:hypothetical protein DLM78_00355 [Leptospira stimsonii]|uniref:Uncharacterized protein n=1 Tax=Leptospira stimsonii TaxID=2202203 RepID=A0A8B3CS34_9LEPT|nr:hypothetical protein DLM78_00355 [Leptospira stimsonii]
MVCRETPIRQGNLESLFIGKGSIFITFHSYPKGRTPDKIETSRENITFVFQPKRQFDRSIVSKV